MVQQGGLARVGIAHDGHHRDLVFDAPLPLGGPDPAHVLQLPLQLGYFPAEHPAVGLQLGLPRAAGPDGALLPLQVLPHPQQAGQQVLVLGQLHLEAALPGPGPLGEDVQNQGGAVQHPHLQRLGQVALLRGGEGVVKDDHIRPQGLDQLLHLGHLALPDEGAGVGAVLGLGDHPQRLAPRRLQQGGQLLHALLVGVLLPAQTERVQPYQNGPVKFRFLL